MDPTINRVPPIWDGALRLVLMTREHQFPELYPNRWYSKRLYQRILFELRKAKTTEEFLDCTDRMITNFEERGI